MFARATFKQVQELIDDTLKNNLDDRNKVVDYSEKELERRMQD